MAARFLLTMPPARPKRWTEATVAPGTRAAMERVLHKLLALQFDPHKSENSPLDVPLSPEGKRAWVTFVDQHGREQADLPNDLVSVWAKTEGYAARFALLDHLVRQVSGEPALTDGRGAIHQRRGNARPLVCGRSGPCIRGDWGRRQRLPRHGSSGSYCGLSGTTEGKSPCEV